MAGGSTLSDTVQRLQAASAERAQIQVTADPKFRNPGAVIEPIKGRAIMVAYSPASTPDESNQASVFPLRPDRIVCAFDAMVAMSLQRDDEENAVVRHTFGASRIQAINRRPRSYSLTFFLELAKTEDSRRTSQSYPQHGVKAWLGAYNSFFRVSALGASRLQNKLLFVLLMRARTIQGGLVSTTVTLSGVTPHHAVGSSIIHVASDDRQLTGDQPEATHGIPPPPWSVFARHLGTDAAVERIISTPELEMQGLRRNLNGGGRGGTSI